MACNECNQNGISKNQIGIIVFGFYLLGASIYGTIEIVKNIISLF